MSPDSDQNHFSGEIKVASRIIDYLSSGLYPSPAACLKELINNSYDADASRVDVFVKPDANRIIVEDNGEGMNREEFEKHFKRISESHKRDDSGTTKSGRPKIGKIGIGFIAANELCEKMEIFSTKKDSKELLHIIIDFEKMRKPIEERRRNGGDIVKADYIGEILTADKKAHYTQIFLQSVLSPKRNSRFGVRVSSILLSWNQVRGSGGRAPGSFKRQVYLPSYKSRLFCIALKRRAGCAQFVE